MAYRVKRDAPTIWLLVKVPKIINDLTLGDATEKHLRDSVRDHHFGGERAAVRRLTENEKRALMVARASRPRKAVPL